jgi:hypothetical protein
MANIKYLVKNLSSNIVLLSYQNSNDNMWNYQVVLRPGQIKNIWCVEGTLSHSGRNSDVSITIDTSTCSSITPTTSPTPIVGDSNPLVLTPITYPGSIGVVYTLTSKYPSDTDITVSFTNILGTNEGSPITINSSVTLFIGETSGSTQVIINDDFTKLNNSSLFSDVIIITDGPSQYFETPISAPPLVLIPIEPFPIFETVYLVTSCCYSGVTGYMSLESSRYTPNWIGYVVIDDNGNCYKVDSVADVFPTLFYGGSYYKSCRTCISKYPCNVVTPTPTPTSSSSSCFVITHVGFSGNCQTLIPTEGGTLINGKKYWETFLNNSIVRIFWDNVNVCWVVKNTNTNEVCSRLYIDSDYPIGAFYDWVGTSPTPLGCNCLTYDDSNFGTAFIDCPPPPPTPTSNPCDVTPTPTPTVSNACPTVQPVINTVFNTTGNTFLLYFTTQGCCSSLTVSWSSNNITWNDSTAGCGSPRTITIANSSSYPILYFRITQIGCGCNPLNSNVLTFNTVTATPTATPGVTPTITPTISLTPSKTPTNTPTKTPTQTPTQTPLRYRPYIVQSCCDPSVTGVALFPTTIQIGSTFVTTNKLCMTVIDKAPKGALPTYTANLQVLFEGCEQCTEQNPCQLTPTPTPTQTPTPTLTLDYTPCLEITSECGTQFAYPGEIINGYVSYTFISGQGYPVLIYWENGNWIVYNTQTEEKCAYLPSYSQYPVGTSSEWISSTPPSKGCSCLAKDTDFNTVLSYCPTPTPTPTSTPTPTPAFCEGNLVTNGQFNSSLSGWTVSNVSSISWEWSNYFGGSAHYIGLKQFGEISQDILTEGATYNITFTLYNYAACTEDAYVVVSAGDNESSQISDTGVTYQNITLICGSGNTLGFSVMDDCASGDTGTIYIDDVCITEIAGPSPTPTPTNTITPTPTMTIGASPTATPTTTPTPTVTTTTTPTPTVTPTETVTGCIDCAVSGYSYIISNSSTVSNCSKCTITYTGPTTTVGFVFGATNCCTGQDIFITFYTNGETRDNVIITPQVITNVNTIPGTNFTATNIINNFICNN